MCKSSRSRNVYAFYLNFCPLLYFVFSLILPPICCMELDQKYTQSSILFVIRNWCLARRKRAEQVYSAFPSYVPPISSDLQVSENYFAFQNVSSWFIKVSMKWHVKSRCWPVTCLIFWTSFLPSEDSVYCHSFLPFWLSLVLVSHSRRAGMSFRPQTGLIKHKEKISE